jgi:hypothetical protein
MVMRSASLTRRVKRRRWAVCSSPNGHRNGRGASGIYAVETSRLINNKVVTKRRGGRAWLNAPDSKCQFYSLGTPPHWTAFRRINPI